MNIRWCVEHEATIRPDDGPEDQCDYWYWVTDVNSLARAGLKDCRLVNAELTLSP